MKYTIEIFENGSWEYCRSYDLLLDAIQFCRVMKCKHVESRYRIIQVYEVF